MVLDVFSIMFEADTSKLDNGVKKSENEADKLNKKLKDVDKNADNLGNGLKNLLATGLGAISAISSFGGVIGGVLNVADFVDQLSDSSKLLNINMNDLVAYQDVVIKAGGSADGLTNTIKALNGELNAVAVKGTSRSLPYFKELGISLLDTAGKARKVTDILPELADKFSKMSKEESAGIGEKLGLDSGTIVALQMGRRELEINLAKQREMFSITENQANAVSNYNDALDDSKIAMRGMSLSIGEYVLPAIQWILEKYTSFITFLKENAPFTKAVFIGLGIAISSFLLPALIRMGAASIVAFAPFYAIGAVVSGVIALFALLYDDIMTFIEGGDSAFQSLLEYMGLTSQEIEAVKQAFLSFGDFVGTIISGIGELFKLLGEVIIMVFQGAFHVIEPILFLIGRLIKEIIGGIVDAIDTIKELSGKVGEGFDASVSTVKNFLGIGGEEAPANSVLDGANSNPVNNFTNAGQNVSKNNSIKIDKVEVHTQATDTDSISRSISDSLGQEISNANNNFDDGIIG